MEKLKNYRLASSAAIFVIVFSSCPRYNEPVPVSIR